MQKPSFPLRKKFLQARKKELELREKKYSDFLSKLKMVLGQNASAFLIGSRARKTNRLGSDLDIVIVIPDEANENKIREEIHRIREKGLPVDLIFIHKHNFTVTNKVLQKMLIGHELIHDGLHVKNTINR